MFSGARDEMMLDERTNGDQGDTLGYMFKPVDSALRASDRVVGDHWEQLKLFLYWVGGVILGLLVWEVMKWG